MISGSYRALMAITLLFGCCIATAQEFPAGQPKGTIEVEVDTSEGKFVLELDLEKAPKSVANFMKYAKSGHYNDTVFHRVIDGFMIQGGGLDRELKEKETSDPVRNEAGNGLKNDTYTVAMARKSDPHSATSQFYINTANNGFLNREEAQDGFGYTVFGRVTEGKEVIDQIAQVPTQARPNPEFPALLMRDVPVRPVVIKGVRLLNNQL